MKASQLVKELLDAIVEHGDMNVVMPNMGEGDIHAPIAGCEIGTCECCGDNWFQLWPESPDEVEVLEPEPEPISN
jgi:hypothetical protein